MHHTKSTPVRIVPHQRGFVKSVIVCSVCIVATTQTSSKINIRSTCVAWKEWTQNSNYNSNISCKVPSLWVVLGSCHKGEAGKLSPIYELWRYNNQAQPSLTYNLGITYQSPTTYIPSWKDKLKFSISLLNYLAI